MAVAMKIAVWVLWIVIIAASLFDVYYSRKSYKSQVESIEIQKKFEMEYIRAKEKEVLEAYEELVKEHKQVQVLIRTVGCVADDLRYMLNKMKKEEM